jgi:uncharacterized protein (DUF2141 family)
MKRIMVLWCAVLLVLFAMSAAAEDGGTLKVTIDGFNNDKGDAKISLFNSKETYLAGNTGVHMAALPIKGGKAQWVLSGLPYGTYAIKIFHDENGNGKLDKNAMGMPKEQFGFSNNARGTFGPPDYEQAKFAFSAANSAITITIE